VIKGTANISTALALRFAELLKLKKRETDYFELLVLFNQAKNPSEKMRYFSRLAAFKKSKFNIIDVQYYELFAKWYYVALCTLLDIYNFTGDYEELGKKLVPSISASEAKKAIQTLQRLGLIKKDANGKFIRADNVNLSTGDSELRSAALENYMLEALELSKRSIDLFPKNQRELSSLTMSLSQKGYEKIKEKLKQFRQELADTAIEDKNENRIYHISFLAFPMSK
jgi:uncharacterized protein (TIGR02147 family)